MAQVEHKFEHNFNVTNCTLDPSQADLSRCGFKGESLQCIQKRLTKHQFGVLNGAPLLTNINEEEQTALCPEKNCDYHQATAQTVDPQEQVLTNS